jgi:hypothetical protein
VNYDTDQWISSFEDAIVKLRPHITTRILTTIGLMAWDQKGTKGVDPALALSHGRSRLTSRNDLNPSTAEQTQRRL